MSCSLNDISYKEGYELAIQNSKSLFKIASTTASENEFGIACSLNILSAEEALKASFLAIKHYNPDGKINEFDKIFHKHTVKHKQLKEFVKFQDKMKEEFRQYVSIYEPMLAFSKTLLKDLPKIDKTEQDSLEETLNWIKKQGEIQLNFGEIMIWLENANSDKNKGFYVDKVNNKWIAPQNITREKYNVEKEYTKAIIDYAMNIEELFSRLVNEKSRR